MVRVLLRNDLIEDLQVAGLDGGEEPAKHFVVELEWDADRLKICARDDGRGFEPDQVRDGLGLLSMRERAGEAGGDFRHEAQPGGDTRLSLELHFRTEDSS